MLHYFLYFLAAAALIMASLFTHSSSSRDAVRRMAILNMLLSAALSLPA